MCAPGHLARPRPERLWPPLPDPASAEMGEARAAMVAPNGADSACGGGHIMFWPRLGSRPGRNRTQPRSSCTPSATLWRAGSS